MIWLSTVVSGFLAFKTFHLLYISSSPFEVVLLLFLALFLLEQMILLVGKLFQSTRCTVNGCTYRILCSPSSRVVVTLLLVGAVLKALVMEAVMVVSLVVIVCLKIYWLALPFS